MPPEGFNPSQRLPTPYQSLGARGLRTLAAKLLLALFPPNSSFFKYSVDDLLLMQMTQRPDMRGEVEKALNSRERATLNEMEAALFRIQAGVALQHLIAAGNYLLHIPTDGPVKGFRLDQYVVSRDPSGRVLDIIVREMVSPDTLPAAIAAAAKTEAGITDEKNVELFTRIKRTKEKWDVWQEAGGKVITSSRGSYPLDRCPWIALRLATQPGEDYGRPYVEEFLGDLDSLEALSETLVEGSAAAARVLFLVKPNGVTSVKVVATARNGDVKSGDANDVTVVQAQKHADLRVAREQAQEIATRLAQAFLLNAAVQRPAERVTAEEIRFMAAELDDALGGIYAMLSVELQLPVVTIFERRMEKNRKVPSLPKGATRPVIITGIEALGRGIDQRNLRAFAADIVNTFSAEVAMRYLKGTEYIKRAAASYGIDTGGLVKTDEEIAEEQQQAMMMEAMNRLGPQAINSLGGMAKEGMKAEAQADQQQQQPQEGQ